MRAILMYHSVDPTGSPVSLPAETFERQVDWLAGSGVRVVDVPELLELDDDEDAVALTFDDAFESFATEAWPRLADRGMPATVFVVSTRVGTTNRWGDVGREAIPDLPLMGWDAIARVADEGATIGHHSRTHPRFYGLDDAALESELAGGRADVEERVGPTTGVFAYPYGDHDARARRAAARVFSCACGTDQRVLREGDDRFALPRLDAAYFRDVARLERWGSPAFRAYVLHLTWRGRLRKVPERVRILAGQDPR